MAQSVELLILGAGWTGQFLIPILQSASITFAATTTTGKIVCDRPTIPFTFDPNDGSLEPYQKLPAASTVLITFPLKGHGQSKHLVEMYKHTHPDTKPLNFVQLGSTGIWSASGYNNHKSPYDMSNARAIAEDELISLGGCVLNLAGLYGGARIPKNWIVRVAKTKEAVKSKGALHLVHGHDVARAIVAVHEKFTPETRWLITDLRVYDWWDLVLQWGGEAETVETPYTQWIGELLVEDSVKSLPRPAEKLGKVLDSMAFWAKMGIWPSRRL